MSSSNCACSAPLKEGAKFCSNCGAAVQEARSKQCTNPACRAPLDGTEAFCSKCGQKIGGSPRAARPAPGGAVCTSCAHFRVIAPVSTLLRGMPGKNAMEALVKITEDETAMRDAEGQKKQEFISMGIGKWDTRPLMSNHCAAHAEQNLFEINELKNRNGDCPDFTAASHPSRQCGSCEFREPHGDPYAPLNGVTNNDFFRAMKDNIDAEIGLEVTAIYAARGDYLGVPKAHDYCRHYSHFDGKAYMALPYPNKHNDCLAYRGKNAPILTPPKMRPAAASDQGVAAILSQFVGAIRAARVGNRDALSSMVIGCFRQLQGALLEEFENFVILVFKMNAQDPVFIPPSHPVLNALSKRAQKLAVDEPKLMESLKGNRFLGQGEYMLLSAQNDFPPDQLAKVCAQTLVEGYWLDRLGMPARRQFLNDERARLEHGMYPEEATALVRRTLQDREHFQAKMEGLAKNDPTGEDLKGVTAFVTPLSNPEFAQGCAEHCARAGCANVFPAQPLDQGQSRLLEKLMAGTFEPDEAVAFLQDRYHALLGVIKAYWQVADPGHVPFDLSPYWNVSHLLAIIDMAHHFVTVMLNRHGRRVPGFRHEDYPLAPRSIFNLKMQEMFRKAERTLEKALFVEEPGLKAITDHTRAEAMRAATPPPPSPSRGKAPKGSQPKKPETLAETIQKLYDKTLSSDPSKARSAEVVLLSLLATVGPKLLGLSHADLAKFTGAENFLLGHVTEPLVDWLKSRELLKA